MEEETAREKQVQAWGAALLVSAQNMGLPAHSTSVPVSSVGAAAAQQSPILPTVQHDSEAELRDKRPAPDSAEELPGPSVGAFKLPIHMIEEETAGEDGDHREEMPSGWHWLRLTQWLKLCVTVVRGGRSWVLVHHYSL